MSEPLLDTESLHAAQFMKALALAHMRLLTLTVGLQSQPVVTSAQLSTWLRNSPSDSDFDCYVSAELESGIAIDWCLELNRSDQWRIHHYVAAIDVHGQFNLKEFPDIVTTTLAGVISALDDSSTDLVGTVEEFDLTQSETWRNEYDRYDRTDSA